LAPANDSASQAFADMIDTTVVIPKLDLAGTRLFDALTALARAYNLSIYIDSSVVGNITLRLDNVSLHDALLFIIKEYKLDWESTGSIVKIFRPVPPPPVPEPLDLVYKNGRLSVDFESADLNRVVDTLIELTGRNIIIEDRAKGRLTGKLKDLEFEQALKVLLPANGFAYRKMDQVIYVGSGSADKDGRVSTKNLYANCDEGLVTLEAANVR
ncbi:MAG: hypothetical protein GY832_38675, partial [Chloroflexi bacterium]|nr:hypothetical protein [Chloroflexota bacterium]